MPGDSLVSLVSAPMPGIEIRPVTTAAQRSAFIRLRRQLYRDDSSVVFPLDSMERLKVDPQKHPFYEHASRELFLAYRGDQVVGRIAAIHDELAQQHCQNRVGSFGFLEAIDDVEVIRQLTQTASDWLASRGCDRICGPMDPSMKAEFGVLTQGAETPPYIMTAHGKRRYRDQLLACGFEVVREFYAFRFRSADHRTARDRWSKLRQARERILRRFPQLNIREVDSQTFETTMREVNELGNRVRAAGWGFVPLTDAELEFMIANLRRVIRYDMIHVAYWEERLVGYIVNIPDVNWALQRTIGKWDWLRMLQLPFLLKKTPQTRVIALGVDEDFRTKGIAMLLIAGLVDTYDAFEEWEFSWVDSENTKSLRAIERTLPLQKAKTYQLLEKAI